MKKYEIEITETFQKMIKVNASDIDEAINKVIKKYKNEEIVLDSDDFVEVSFSEIKTKNEKEIICK